MSHVIRTRHTPAEIDGVLVQVQCRPARCGTRKHGEDQDALVRCAGVALSAARLRRDGQAVYAASMEPDAHNLSLLAELALEVCAQWHSAGSIWRYRSI